MTTFRPTWSRRLAAPATICTVRVVLVAAAAQLLVEVWAFGVVRHWGWLPCGGLLTTAWMAAFVMAVSLGRGVVARLAAAGTAALCAVDAGSFAVGCAQGRWVAALPVPVSLPIGLALAYWALRPDEPIRRSLWRRGAHVLVGAVIAVVLVFWHLGAAGALDRSRPADAIVVLGAGVHSTSMNDRTVAACDLYARGLARYIVLSGGRGEGQAVSEPEAMRQIAHSRGVPDTALVLDENGINTLATVRNCRQLARERGWSSVLVVSHDYHMARLQMMCDRVGLTAYTVPVSSRGFRLSTVVSMYAREFAALGFYFFLPGINDPE